MRTIYIYLFLFYIIRKIHLFIKEKEYVHDFVDQHITPISESTESLFDIYTEFKYFTMGPCPTPSGWGKHRFGRRIFKFLFFQKITKGFGATQIQSRSVSNVLLISGLKLYRFAPWQKILRGEYK